MKHYNSAIEAHFSNNLLILRHLDIISNIPIKCQKNTATVEIGLFRPIFATNNGSKAQKRSQNPSQIPSIYIFTDDAAQLGADTYSPASQPSQSTEETPAKQKYSPSPKSPSEKSRPSENTTPPMPHPHQQIPARQMEQFISVQPILHL